VPSEDQSQDSSAYASQLRHSIDEVVRQEVDRLTRERLLPIVLIMFAFWIVSAVEWTQRLAGAIPDPRFWTFLALIVTAYSGLQVFRLRRGFPQWVRRKQNDQEIASILERIRPKGFVAYRDAAADGAAINHVVIGPAGIYAVQAKGRSGSGVIDYRGEDELVFGDRIRDGRALPQTRAYAHALQAKLNESLQASHTVKPLVVVLGKWRLNRTQENFPMQVITGDGLESYFDSQPSELTAKEIAQISSYFENATEN
jgi:hypothetical protein